MCVHAKLCLTLCHPMDCSPPGFSRKEHWSRLPCPPPGDLPNPGIEPLHLTSPTLSGRFFLPLVPPRKPPKGSISCYIQLPWLAQVVKNLPAMLETWVRSLSQEDPLEKEMATHSSILTWEIPRTEELGGLQSMGHKVSHMTE